jgi:hypothetical protein
MQVIYRCNSTFWSTTYTELQYVYEGVYTVEGTTYDIFIQYG